MRDYVRRVGENHRKSRGQYFTPPDVAGFMTSWVLRSGGTSLFDPAFGLGAFHDAVPHDARVDFSACEIDPGIVEFRERTTGRRAGFVTVDDYLRSWGGRHSNIVCNPPYMRFQKFVNRAMVRREFRRRLGVNLSGYTNTASAFLLKSLSELRAPGRMAYLMPLEFLNTGYGTPVKAALTDSGHLFAILRFDCEKDIFPDAATSVGVILFDNAVRHASVKFYAVRSLTQLARFDEMAPVSDVPVAALDARAKWLPWFQPRACEADPARMTVLSTFGRFSRGIATGANEFFVLRPSTARARGLDAYADCVPCITRSVQIRKPIFDAADYHALSDADHPVLLFSANGAPSRDAAVYIRSGERRGFHERFLTKTRTPWYRTERREPSPLLFGVFSRGRYKVVFNTSRALTLTCFHGFQPNPLGRRYAAHLFLYLASQTGRDIMSRSMRRYGALLDKVEPNDVNGSPVPSPDFFATIREERVAEAMTVVNGTGRLPSWAEALFAPVKIPDKKKEEEP